MPTFTYIAKRADGAETRGKIDAVSIDAAREELRKQGLMVEDLREQQPQRQQQQPGRPAQQPKPQQPQQQKPANQQQKPPQPKPQVPKPTVQQPPKPIIQASPAPKASKPEPLPWSGANNGAAPKLPDETMYAPMHETLRIFAGWLLAWYGLIYALGFLEQTGKLSPIPFIHELFASRLVLQFTFGTFLVLALSNVHRWLGRGPFVGFALSLAYLGALAGFVIYG